MRLVSLLVAAMSSISAPQAVAPAPGPTAAIVAPAPPVKKPSHEFATPLGIVTVDDDVCDVLDTGNGSLYIFVPYPQEFSVSTQNCADAVRQMLFRRPAKPMKRA